jgi:hypothetical protein
MQLDPKVHQAARIIAGRCRNIIQACLRDDEQILAEQEFYIVCHEVIEELMAHEAGRIEIAARGNQAG